MAIIALCRAKRVPRKTLVFHRTLWKSPKTDVWGGFAIRKTEFFGTKNPEWGPNGGRKYLLGVIKPVFCRAKPGGFGG
jgi:hypothetical protein